MIRTDQLSFKIGDFQLNQVSIKVPQGEYFVLLGPPGSGKSVFLECLCGLAQIVSGQIHIDGKESWSWADIEPNWKYESKEPGVNPWNEVAREKLAARDN